jgi:hypothetical protein
VAAQEEPFDAPCSVGLKAGDVIASDLVSLLERAISAEYRFVLLHAAAPGRNVLLNTRSTEDLLGWSAEHRFLPAADRSN